MKAISTIIGSMKEKSEIKKFVNKWLVLMVETKTYNNEYETLTMNKIEKTDKGYKFRVYCPLGLTFTDLENIKEMIECSFKCKFDFTIENFNKYANAEMQFEN